MACIRCVYGYRRKNGNCNLKNQNLVRLYFFSYYGISAYYLFRSCILVKYQALYSLCQEKSRSLSVMFRKFLTDGLSQLNQLLKQSFEQI